ncbi:P1 family peptidase [Ferrimonas lipolytica]|uniref:P1 family peptidase n=1 Tax=Ferrimonas lipolytica TaxID=2724191 RepID=A0A6H1UHM4_9GAMM|nr:P1 family peptidase [Ferrimonas lipolytica]QIZ78129.1 P1 family peptidase [Ferrimonas lipolytica]
MNLRLGIVAILLSFHAFAADPIFAINGLRVGQQADSQGLTGVTVLRFDQGATAAVDVRGAAPGTRETDLLKPENLVDKVHAIVLSGGSAFGLDAMSGVAAQLESEGVGFDVGIAKVPIVTGAVLFDLAIGDAKARPDFAMGQAATKLAQRSVFTQGNAGAGMGATVGKIRGMEHATKAGIGRAVVSLDNGVVIAAVVAVNAWGDVIARNGALLAASRDNRNGFINGTDLLLSGFNAQGFAGRNTTIGAIITNATLTKVEALKVAQMAHDGYARAIRPVHSMYDGDAIFAAATAEVAAMDINTLGVIAAEVMEQAIRNAITHARTVAGFPAANQIGKPSS